MILQMKMKKKINSHMRLYSNFDPIVHGMIME